MYYDNNNKSKELSQHDIKKLIVAMEQCANAIMITNVDAEIEYVNPIFYKLTGYSPKEVLGRNPKFQKSGYHSQEFYENLWSTIKRGETWNGEFYNRKKNGEFYWESATITPISDEKGMITSFIAIKEDITIRKQQQEAIEKSEKKLKEINLIKDKFFSIIAHDMMNPINALLGFSGLAKEAITNDELEKGIKYVSMVDQYSRQVANLFQNLLLWTRAQSRNIAYQPTDVNVREFVLETISILVPLAQKKEISIELSIPEEMEFSFDKNMISTVIRNLVQNAVKFSYINSIIRIDATITDNDFILSVKDQGMGMTENTKENLFSIAYTRSTKGTDNETGTGLGLVISREFLNYHKGEIWAESELGKGSQFYIRIPKNNSLEN